MPDFVATERDNAPPPPPREPLDKWSDGTAVNHYYMRSKTDDVIDVCKPGYFNFMKETFRSGGHKGVVHYVTCLLGQIEDGLTEVRLHLIDAPGGFSGDVIMAKGESRKFTPVRHDGALDEDKPKVKATA